MLNPAGAVRQTLPRLTTLLLPAGLVLALASPAHAVQTHTGTEGLISHELGHLLFTVAMIVLLVRMLRAGLDAPGWRQFRWFLGFIIAWNLLTFAGHWMREGIAAENFIRHGDRITGFAVNNLFDLIFYLTRLDHLLLVPAFFMLLMAILKWSEERQ